MTTQRHPKGAAASKGGKFAAGAGQASRVGLPASASDDKDDLGVGDAVSPLEAAQAALDAAKAAEEVAQVALRAAQAATREAQAALKRADAGRINAEWTAAKKLVVEAMDALNDARNRTPASRLLDVEDHAPRLEAARALSRAQQPLYKLQQDVMAANGWGCNS